MDEDDRPNHFRRYFSAANGYYFPGNGYYFPPTDTDDDYFSSGNPRSPANPYLSPANPYLSSGINRPQSGAYYHPGRFSGDFSGTTLTYVPPGNPQPRPANAFVFPDDYRRRIFGGYYPQLEPNSYEFGNSNYDTFLSPLESEFSHLSLSSPLRPPPFAAADISRRAQPPEFYHHSNRFSYNYRGTDETGSSSPLHRPPSISERPISELRGEIFSAAKDHSKSRILISKLGNPEAVQMIFSEVKDHICELMNDAAGSYFMQKFFAVLNEHQMSHLLGLLINDENAFKDTCTDTHGTRGVQKLLEHLKTRYQRSLVLSVLRRITLCLIKNHNGQHVIHYCIKNFHHEETKHILNVVADNCLDIATDKSGCCAIQQCLSRSIGEPLDRIIARIIFNALVLSEHPYGNYVVQFMLGFRMPRATFDIRMQLSGRFVSLSLNKYGSNVVEKLLKQSKGDQALPIIEELASDFLSVVQDPYGNYVAQSALDVSYREHMAWHRELMKLLRLNDEFLQSHPFGRRVLKKAEGFEPVWP